MPGPAAQETGSLAFRSDRYLNTDRLSSQKRSAPANLICPKAVVLCAVYPKAFWTKQPVMRGSSAVMLAG